METKKDWKHVVAQPCNGDHMVQIYSNTQFLCEAVGLYVASALRANKAVILISREKHWDIFQKQFQKMGLTLEAALETGQLAALNAEDTLSQFAVGGRHDAQRFQEVVGALISKAIGRFGEVAAYGEMVDLLWHQGDREGAIKLEELWNHLAETFSFSLLCGYGLDSLEAQVYGGALQSICDKHSHFIPADNYPRWDHAVERALGDILEPGEVLCLQEVLTHQPFKTQMPRGAAMLLCLNEKLPILGAKVVQRVGQYYQSGQSEAAA